MDFYTLNKPINYFNFHPINILGPVWNEWMNEFSKISMNDTVVGLNERKNIYLIKKSPRKKKIKAWISWNLIYLKKVKNKKKVSKILKLKKKNFQKLS